MKNVSIFTPEIRVLCEFSCTEPLWNFTEKKKRKKKEKVREALKNREKTLFLSSPYNCSTEAFIPGSLCQRSGVSWMWKADFNRGRRKGLGCRSHEPPELHPFERGVQ